MQGNSVLHFAVNSASFLPVAECRGVPESMNDIIDHVTEGALEITIQSEPIGPVRNMSGISEDKIVRQSVLGRLDVVMCRKYHTCTLTAVRK